MLLTQKLAHQKLLIHLFTLQHKIQNHWQHLNNTPSAAKPLLKKWMMRIAAYTLMLAHQKIQTSFLNDQIVATMKFNTLMEYFTVPHTF